MVDQEPGGEKTAIEQLEYLKAVFSEEGADGVGEQLQSMDRDTLRTVTAAAGLSRRAGGKLRSVAEWRFALKDHVASALAEAFPVISQCGPLHFSPLCGYSGLLFEATRLKPGCFE